MNSITHRSTPYPSFSTALKTFTLAYLARGTQGSPFISSQLIAISLNPTTPTLSADCTQLAGRDIPIVWRRGESILTRTFTTSLTPSSPETTCSQNTLNYQPKNQALSDGGFVNIWFSIENDEWKIVFQRYDKQSKKIGSITEAFPDISSQQGNADITRLIDGRIVISCTIADFSVAPGRKGPGIIYQGFSPTMDPIPSFRGEAFGTNLGDHDDSSLSPTPDGGLDITFTANGKIIRQHIDTGGKKIGAPIKIKSTQGSYYYHPSTASLKFGSVAAWAKTNSSGDIVSSYEFSVLSSNSSKIGPDQILKTTPPNIPWTKLWTTFQNYLKAIPDPFGGFTLLARVNNTVVQQHFYTLISPGGPIITVAQDEDPYLQISGCPTNKGWITLVSNTSGLYAQTNLFSPSTAPSPSPTQNSTRSPTSAPASTPQPSFAPTLIPSPSPQMPLPPPKKVKNGPPPTFFIVAMSFMFCVMSAAGGLYAYIRYRNRRDYEWL